MRKLWGRTNSSNVMKVIWLLEELGLPYERVDWGGPFGGNDDPAYRALHPGGLVPTLEEDGLVLFESNAILRHLCAMHARPPIWPEPGPARARADVWCDWQQTTLNASQTVVFQGLVRTPPERRDSAAIETAGLRLGELWGVVDRALGRSEFLGGDAFSFGDIPLGVHVHRWFSFAMARPDFPNLKRWYDALLARPVYAAHVAKPMT